MYVTTVTKRWFYEVLIGEVILSAFKYTCEGGVYIIGFLIDDIN